jgi:para-aminobenzoate synthetase component 1
MHAPFPGMAAALRACGNQVMLRWEREQGYFRGFIDFENALTLDAGRVGQDLQHLSQHAKTPGDRGTCSGFNGWVGFFGYEWLCALRGNVCSAPRDIDGIADGIFARPQVTFIIVNNTMTLYGTDPERLRFWAQKFAQATDGVGSHHPIEAYPPRVNCEFPTYEKIFLQAKEAIKDGETYQIKLSIRHQAPAPEPAAAFARLVQNNPAPEAFYLRWDDFILVSCSPETVIDLRNNSLSTRPIGGTFARDQTCPAVDLEALQLAFANNSKETAEHNMLIDLERNDLNTICKSGSVHITHLREIESYAHVHHLVSRIAGELAPQASRGDILRAMLPGGSITGCPKHRTIELIDRWEPSFRGPYTGSFGTLEDNGNMHLNLIIRTLMIKGPHAYVQAGGGIVLQSTPQYEYRENLLKGKALMDLLQQ